jgi:hypothetical protein
MPWVVAYSFILNGALLAKHSAHPCKLGYRQFGSRPAPQHPEAPQIEVKGAAPRSLQVLWLEGIEGIYGFAVFLIINYYQNGKADFKIVKWRFFALPRVSPPTTLRLFLPFFIFTSFLTYQVVLTHTKMVAKGRKVALATLTRVSPPTTLRHFCRLEGKTV